MAQIDLADDTFIVCDRQVLSTVVHDPTNWQQWWPELTLVVFMDRGLDGIRWSATGELSGSVEVWLEPVLDGVVVHHYLRLDPADVAGARKIDRTRKRYAKAWKQSVWRLKDAVEGARAVGSAR